jgi:DNA-binding winged helix-turn-helix (wHTH) protein
LYEFGPFRLDPHERSLTRDYLALALTPKAFDILLALVESSRHVLTKEELMNRIWPDIYVEETNLAQHISMLRKVLGEKPGGGQFIETVPKRGYRFAVPVNKIRYEPSQLKTNEVSQEGDGARKKSADYETAVSAGESPDIERITTVKVGTRLGRYEIISQLGAGGMGATRPPCSAQATVGKIYRKLVMAPPLHP